MAHKTIIGGTAYEISGGKTLIGGTAYSIKNGKTLVGGTAYEVGFGEKVTITIVRINEYDQDPGYSWVEINGQAYLGDATPKAITVEVGTKIVCWISNSFFTCTLNGESITLTEPGTTPPTRYYELTAMTDIDIELRNEYLSFFGGSYGGSFHITTY